MQAILLCGAAVAFAALMALALRDRSAEPAPAPAAGVVGATATAADPLETEAEPAHPARETATAGACAPDARPGVFDSSAAASHETSTVDTAGARERLLLSLDAEHLTAAALLAAGSADRIDNITRALARDRNNATLVFTAVRICAQAVDEADCPAEMWERELLRLDGENSEVWVRIATDRLRRGEGDAALRALQRAASSAETRDYWPETIELLERALAAAGGYAFSTRVDLAFGLAAANLPDYGAYVQMCETQSEANPAWADACLRYGQLAERQSRTDMGQAIARAIQVSALETMGDERARNQVAARQEQGRRDRNAIGRAEGEAMIFGSPTHFSMYLAALRERGESAAQQVLQDEAERLAIELDPAGCR